MIVQYSTAEKDQILSNAISSFAHGIEHLVNYRMEKNIKFSVLHIFNALELLVKAYIGSNNIVLLRPNIDKSSEKIADISLLIERMKTCSSVEFDENLIKDVDILRNRRNEIEHKKFKLEDKDIEEIMTILVRIASELKVFSHKNLAKDLRQELPSELETEFNNLRLQFDDKFKYAEERMKERGVVDRAQCTNCFNFTVPFLNRECEVPCFYCNAPQYILKCYNCEEFHLNNYAEDRFFCEKCRPADIGYGVIVGMIKDARQAARNKLRKLYY